VRARSDAQPTSRRSGVYRWQVDVPKSVLLGDWAAQVSEMRAPGLATSLGRVELSAYPIRVTPGTENLLPAEAILGARFVVLDAPAGPEFDTFIALDNDGVGLGPSPPAELITTFPSAFVDGGVMFEVWTYQVGGAPVYGVMCQPRARAPDEPLRTLIWNHRGIRTDQEAAAAAALGADTSAGVGLGVADLELCENMAKLGWRVAMSAYRYQGVSRLNCTPTPSPTDRCRPIAYSCSPKATLPAGFDLPLPGGPFSLRESEFCLSETADVMRWTEIVRGMPGVDPNSILMMGGSHGACVTLGRTGCAGEGRDRARAASRLRARCTGARGNPPGRVAPRVLCERLAPPPRRAPRRSAGGVPCALTAAYGRRPSAAPRFPVACGR